MKKISIAISIILAFLLILSSCGKKEESTPGEKIVVIGETVFTVDENMNTISDGKDTYRYSYQASGAGYTLRLIYPNGYTWTWTQNGNSGYGTASLDRDHTGYQDPFTLQDALEYKAPKQKGESHIGIGLLLLALGLFNTLKPEVAWMLSDGWKFKNAEPSDAALGLTRVGGVIMILIGIIAIISSF